MSGTPIAKMAGDLDVGGLRARAASGDIDGVILVDRAWNRAFTDGVADADP